LAQTRISAAIARIDIGEIDGAAELLAPVLATRRPNGSDPSQHACSASSAPSPPGVN
jgi:hypothetical protein